MKDPEQLLYEHYVNFPAMEVQDAVKFLYQHYMGPGHLIADQEAAAVRLQEEWATVRPDETAPPSHSLGNGLCRLNLNFCKASELSTSTVLKIFLLTCRQVSPNFSGLKQSLDLVHTLPFPKEQADAYLSQYRAAGCPMVSHSPQFRQLYSPAYRVVCEYYVNIMPVLCAIDRAMGNVPAVRVAIDGPCASGKSTLAAALSEIYGCPVIHMDDFFLRPEQRSPERLALPGENVDHERFSEQVLVPLLNGRPVQYRPWRCHEGAFGPEVTITPAPLTVVEGCYSLRPDLRDAFQLRIWVEASGDTRRQRLLDRGGPECLTSFEQRWIPLENHYFDRFQVKQCCHVHLPA